MLHMKKTFPDGFLWGASTAAYQVEGGIEQVDWAEAARDGKVPVCGRACDHYNQYEEDFDLIVQLHQNAHRFSIEWARIEPEEGLFNYEEIAHYRKVLHALKRRGITPCVNLWHFTLPLWVSKRGGFLHRDTAKLFARYCAFIIEQLGEETDMWLTLNEPLVYSTKGYMEATWPPFHRNPFAYMRVLNQLAHAHRLAYRAMKKVRPAIKIGIAKHNIYYEGNGNPLYEPLVVFLRWFWNHRFLRNIKGHQDFIGLNHYFHGKIGASRREQESVPHSDMGWEIHPESLYQCLRELKQYKLPVYVTENGIADATDTKRSSFITEYIAAVHRAIAEGVDVRGYFYWSLLDNYEWAEGFTQRFGLVDIEYATLKRTVRPSAHVYAEICKNNSL
jgi:beta-glucosidase